MQNLEVLSLKLAKLHPSSRWKRAQRAKLRSDLVRGHLYTTDFGNENLPWINLPQISQKHKSLIHGKISDENLINLFFINFP